MLVTRALDAARRTWMAEDSRPRLWALFGILTVAHILLLAVGAFSQEPRGDKATLLAATVIGPAAAFVGWAALTGPKPRSPSALAERLGVLGRCLVAGGVGFATATVATIFAVKVREPTPCDLNPDCIPPESFELVIYSSLAVELAAVGGVIWAISIGLRSRCRSARREQAERPG